MGQKRSSRQNPAPDEKELEKAVQKAPDETLEWMVYLCESDPWLEISYLMQVQHPKPQSGSNRHQIS